MSLKSGEQLPLPAEPKSIADIPGLHSVWTILVLLSNEVRVGKVEFRRNVGPIMLAFKYLQAAIPKAYTAAVGATKDELAEAAHAVTAAAKWVRHSPHVGGTEALALHFLDIHFPSLTLAFHFPDTHLLYP